MLTLLKGIAAVLGPLALAAGSVTFAADGGHRAGRTLPDAIAHTSASRSEHYAIRVRMTRGHRPMTLHVRGQSAERTLSVSLRRGAVKLPDGTKVPGPSTAALIDGPFLYERAPSTVAAAGKVRWLRVRLAELPRGSRDLTVIHSLTPKPLLGVLDAARIAPAARGARTFHGTIAYDHPAVLKGLAQLTGGLELRGIRISANVGADGFVHRIVLTGRTPDGTTRFSLRAQLYGFGKPVHVTPPAPGTFLDPHGGPPA